MSAVVSFRVHTLTQKTNPTPLLSFSTGRQERYGMAGRPPANVSGPKEVHGDLGTIPASLCGLGPGQSFPDILHETESRTTQCQALRTAQLSIFEPLCLFFQSFQFDSYSKFFHYCLYYVYYYAIPAQFIPLCITQTFSPHIR